MVQVKSYETVSKFVKVMQRKLWPSVFKVIPGYFVDF